MQVSIQERQIMKALYNAGFGTLLDDQVQQAKNSKSTRSRLSHDLSNPLGHMFYEPEVYFGDKAGKLNGFHATFIRDFRPDHEIAGIDLRALINKILHLGPAQSPEAKGKAHQTMVKNIKAELDELKKREFHAFASIAGQYRHADLLLSKDDKQGISSFRVRNVRSKWIPASEQLTMQEVQLIMSDIRNPRAFVKKVFEIPEAEGKTEAQQAIKGEYKEYWRCINYIRPDDIKYSPGDNENGTKAKKAAMEKDIPDGMLYLVKKPVDEINLDSIRNFNFLGLEEKENFRDFSNTMRKGDSIVMETGSQQHPLVTVSVNGAYATWRFLDAYQKPIKHELLLLANQETSQQVSSTVSSNTGKPEIPHREDPGKKRT